LDLRKGKKVAIEAAAQVILDNQIASERSQMRPSERKEVQLQRSRHPSIKMF
jgi:hypothetical protein